ncbi:MAG: 3-deoxy-8-phosphooctulonate synthase [Flavobacteriales bacterium]|nr:3-deoxy-8-phosphooctulonate synthase [Flavobacteriales bacterium]MBT5698651.1 3-deoxy-8-phosphooctulonate synthase [Flavobacteriales bacterium]MBT6815869.1 3-deoxy-8-phosphooctulonate synthase [Flavobacteriales bacterium]MBT7725992.1 3-deoxy-8-phosphooctulonate synthase [Flavobacteriales bacterium]
MLSKINNLQHQKSGNFFLIAGPCVIESEKIAMEIAEKTLNICNKLEIPFIFKGSYRKANRSRIDSFTGIGDKEALSILKKVGEKFNIPTLTDIHSEEEASIAAQYVDVLQIPAFLCRQTDLLVAAARTGKIVNIKKGQFLSPKSMEHAVTKVKESGNNTIMITDRGTMFGYQDIVVDFRGIPTMKQFGVPVVMDITHSLQQPNQDSGITGGNPKMIEIISKAAIATGVDGIFLETHPNPSKAKSDGSNMLELDKLEELLVKLVKIRKVI